MESIEIMNLDLAPTILGIILLLYFLIKIIVPIIYPEAIRDNFEGWHMFADISSRKEKKRVVNIIISRRCLFFFKRILKPSGLIKNNSFLMEINIGLPLRKSIISNPKLFSIKQSPILEEGYWLDAYFESVELRDLPSDPISFFLPIKGNSWFCECDHNKRHTCKKSERKPFLTIPFKTPNRTGKFKLKIAIFLKTNILQVLYITGDIKDKPTHSGKIEVSYDYQLTSNFKNIKNYKERSLAIHTSDVRNGYEFLVKNQKIKEISIRSLNDGQITNAVNPIRRAMKEIYYSEKGLFGQKSKTIHFNNKNQKGKEEFIEDLKKLAWLGQRLWTVAISPQKRFYDIEAPFIIQVARSISSTTVFPWAMIYDIPLVITEKDPLRSNEFRLCKIIDEMYVNSTVLQEETTKCPFEHEHEENTLCPFGFWGYKYIIEQPVSGDHNKHSTIMTSVMPPNITVGFTNKTVEKLRDEHFSKIEPYSGFVSLKDLEKQFIEKIEVLYFYAHGIKEPLVEGEEENFVPALEIGNDVVIRSDVIAGWPRRKITDKWLENPPLVFINGCHTAEFTPDLLSNLVTSFSTAGAAGVIGTEIPINQRLANEAAEVLFEELFKEIPVGEAIRRMRLHLLKKGNLLGLAYTPYCMGNLQIKKAENIHTILGVILNEKSLIKFKKG